MLQQTKYLRLSNEFIVHEEHINDKGTLTVCKILREITQQYDRAIIEAFGDLNYYKIKASSYHMDLIDIAHKGDVIKLETEAILHLGLYIDLNIIVNNSSQKNKTLAIGHFIFSKQSNIFKQAICLS